MITTYPALDTIGLDELVERGSLLTRVDRKYALTAADAGMAVLFISSEISEVVRVAHRIVVLHDRRKVGELPGGSSEDEVYELITAQHA